LLFPQDKGRSPIIGTSLCHEKKPFVAGSPFFRVEIPVLASPVVQRRLRSSLLHHDDSIAAS
jgi:hypothetical protein